MIFKVASNLSHSVTQLTLTHLIVLLLVSYLSMAVFFFPLKAHSPSQQPHLSDFVFCDVRV